jgi:CheY-like chemotaxis protein
MSLKVLVFSDDAAIRTQVLTALGTSVAPELPKLEFIEVATEPVVLRTLAAGHIDLVILDGEAHPAGGLGICRQIKDEIFNAPPVIVLIGRAADGWLATWSRAEGVVPQPIDPVVLAETAATLLRQRVSVASA